MYHSPNTPLFSKALFPIWGDDAGKAGKLLFARKEVFPLSPRPSHPFKKSENTSAAREFLGGGVAGVFSPEALEVVAFAALGSHQVDDKIAEIEQHPAA